MTIILTYPASRQVKLKLLERINEDKALKREWQTPQVLSFSDVLSYIIGVNLSQMYHRQLASFWKR